MYKEKYFRDKEILITNQIFDDIKKVLPLLVDCMIVLWFCLKKKILFFSYACQNTYGKHNVTSGFDSK